MNRFLLGSSIFATLIGCSNIAPYMFMREQDQKIKENAKIIESTHDVDTRAKALSERGHAYSEKARYGKFIQHMAGAEYQKLFDLAIADQNESIKLTSNNAQVYFQRGVTYYDRANLETPASSKPWYRLSQSDFQKASEIDPKDKWNFDRLGLAYESAEDFDAAILAYEHEMQLDAFGKTRLADVYCRRGVRFVTAKKYKEAVSDLAKSVELGATADGCSCDPYNPLLAAYIEAKDFDRGLTLIDQAKASKKFIDPELIQFLHQKSGK